MALINAVTEVLHRIRVKLYPNYLPHVEGRTVWIRKPVPAGAGLETGRKKGIFRRYAVKIKEETQNRLSGKKCTGFGLR